MIQFERFSDSKKGIYFSSYSKNNFTIVGEIKDPYTGLCLWKTRMEISPDVVYFFSCDYLKIKNLRFEIFDILDGSLLLRVDSKTDEIYQIEDFDSFGKLKSFQYDGKSEDSFAGVPLISIFIDREYEREKCVVEDGDVVFDIGANLGFFSYYSFCKGASKVYCFEPGSSQISSIKKNFGSFQNLIIEESAVSNINGELKFYYNPESSWESSLTPLENITPVICKSIDLNNYIENQKIEKIDFLKIDCEGEEYKIIASLNSDFLTHRVKKMCIEYHNNDGRMLYDLIQKLVKCNFKIDLLGNDIKETSQGMMYAWK